MRSAPTCTRRPAASSTGSTTLGVYTPNRVGLPVIEIPLARRRATSTTSGRFLFDNGVYVTLAAYPLVPTHEVGFRIQVTAANTDEEIDHLVDVLGRLAERHPLQSIERTAA